MYFDFHSVHALLFLFYITVWTAFEEPLSCWSYGILYTTNYIPAPKHSIGYLARKCWWSKKKKKKLRSVAAVCSQ